MKKVAVIVTGAKVDIDFQDKINEFLKSGRKSMIITLPDRGKVEFQAIEVSVSLIKRLKTLLVG